MTFSEYGVLGARVPPPGAGPPDIIAKMPSPTDSFATNETDRTEVPDFFRDTPWRFSYCTSRFHHMGSYERVDALEDAKVGE